MSEISQTNLSSLSSSMSISEDINVQLACSNESLRLPVLDMLVTRIKSSQNPLPFARTALVFVHHALHSSISVLEAQFKLGLDPKNTFVLNKTYSECSDVVEKTRRLGVHYQPCTSQIGAGNYTHAFIRDINFLWRRVLSHLNDVDNLLVMDHGGYAMLFIPPELLKKYRVVGVEKTTSGLMNPHIEKLPFPIVNVATCAAKKFLESPLIADAIIAKLPLWVPITNSKLICGVVGYGAIGKAVARKLISMGHKVIIYDLNHKKHVETEGVTLTEDLSALLSFSDYIFGCTGTDISGAIGIFKISPRDKVLISCSSGDNEFLSLLKYIQKQNQTIVRPLSDIIYTNESGATIKLIKGGFPVNFDNTGESVPLSDIQLTRALILAASIQATSVFKNSDLLSKNIRYILDPNLQRIVVEEWFKCQSQERFSDEIRQKFNNNDWIIKHSGGVYKKKCAVCI